MESEPAEKIKEMFFLYKENIALYKQQKYVKCAVSCENITFVLDSLHLSKIKDIGRQNTCRQIRRKLLEQIGKLHESCIVKLNS
jgi:hypothetical protein|tara:strand:+ start:1568 stop:1819 length:252 start_codon:yes stop_codon:yes gene_type:complete